MKFIEPSVERHSRCAGLPYQVPHEDIAMQLPLAPKPTGAHAGNFSSTLRNDTIIPLEISPLPLRFFPSFFLSHPTPAGQCSGH